MYFWFANPEKENEWLCIVVNDPDGETTKTLFSGNYPIFYGKVINPSGRHLTTDEFRQLLN